MEPIPGEYGGSVDSSSFFPESSKEAAPEVAQALLRAFVNSFYRENASSPRSIAPSRLTTAHQDLAAAISDEFQRLGVRRRALCNIGLSTSSVNENAHSNFHAFFTGLIKGTYVDENVVRKISTPTSIDFGNLDSRPCFEQDKSYIELLVDYTEQIKLSVPIDCPCASSRAMQSIHIIQNLSLDSPTLSLRKRLMLAIPKPRWILV
ncbi:hypothetical protein CPB84DRAFT_1847766 [Gymnopilus junonius]|uniref:Uncharacterized protein n=1 Tax=Gymnopilus junonius TaxID=109634 RepID=A0A9P5TLG0_GYMJU|nr:hypothetical protein CPB84DRAFT_1847766 [Gymnopilus junonius]